MDQSPTAAGVDEPFDLTLSDEQQMAVDSLTRFANEVMRPAAQEADLQGQLPADYLQQVAQFGLALMNVPESCGGGGARSAVSGCLIAETLAAGDMAMAMAALAPASFVNALVDQGTQQQQQHWLPPLAGGDFVAATVAFAEGGAGGDLRRPATVAKRDGDDWLLTGSKLAVPLGGSAELLLVSASDAAAAEGGDGAGESVGVFVVEKGAKGLQTSTERWMGLCALDLAEVSLDSVRVPALARLGSAQQPLDLERLLALGRLGMAALATGVCRAVVDYCVPYCNEREAFGEPISHRQAVAFKLADAATETEGLRLLVWRAAGLADRGGDLVRAAALAHSFAARRGMQIGSDGVQLLGGHGYTREHPVELWYRNLRALAVLQAGTLV